MRWGITGAPVPPQLPYAGFVRRACMANDFPPLLAYAVACNETIVGEINGKWTAATVISPDNGHGLFQLTSWWPEPGWDDPGVNAYHAVRDWLLPDAIRWFQQYRLVGDDLVRCTAASFNAGWTQAVAGHLTGDVDRYTTDRYGERALTIYRTLRDKGEL